MVRRSKGLGERHRRILEFIESYQKINKHPPSIREIGEACDISSTSVVNYYLDQMEKKGVIERDRKISRGVKASSRDAVSLGQIIRINLELAFASLAGDSTTNAPPPTSNIKKKKRKSE